MTREQKQVAVEDAVAAFLDGLGIEWQENQHFKDTPVRVAKAWLDYFTIGYTDDPKVILKSEFKADYDQMVVVTDIPFYSMCAHHLLPFRGTAKIGYIPKDGIVTGLSKLHRLVEAYARRLQIQEQMCHDIAKALQEVLRPIGVGVVLKAEHLCVSSRGVEKPGTIMVTSCLLGAMRDEPETRAEFLDL